YPWHTVIVALDGQPLTGVTKIAAGTFHTCALADGKVYCWGKNGSGQIGSGGREAWDKAYSLRLTGAFDYVATGGDFTCVGDPVYCWGDNSSAQVGDASQLDAASTDWPLMRPDLSGKQSLTLGERHACVRDGDRALCWGFDDMRQCGAPPNKTCSGGG